MSLYKKLTRSNNTQKAPMYSCMNIRLGNGQLILFLIQLGPLQNITVGTTCPYNFPTSAQSVDHKTVGSNCNKTLATISKAAAYTQGSFPCCWHWWLRPQIQRQLYCLFWFPPWHQGQHFEFGTLFYCDRTFLTGNSINKSHLKSTKVLSLQLICEIPGGCDTCALKLGPLGFLLGPSRGSTFMQKPICQGG